MVETVSISPVTIYSHWNPNKHEWCSNYELANLWPGLKQKGWQTRDFVIKLQMIMSKNTSAFPLTFEPYNPDSTQGFYLIFYGGSSPILEHHGLAVLDPKIADKINQGHLKLLIAFTHETFDTGICTREWFGHFCNKLTALGITRHKSVVILTGTSWSSRFVNDQRCEFVFYPWFEADLQTSFLIANKSPTVIDLGQKQKHFINLNQVIRPHRFLMVMYLSYRNIAQHGNVSWHNANCLSWKEIITSKGFGQVGLNWLAQIDRHDRTSIGFMNFLQTVNVLDSIQLDDVTAAMGNSGPHNGPTWVGGDHLYASSWVDLVSETHCELYGDVFATEKSFKPMAHGLPFVFWASRNHLHLIKKLGYQSFPDLFKEDYDTMPAGIDKLVCVADKIIEFCVRPDLMELAKSPSVQERLKFNQDLFWGKNHAQQIGQLLHQAWSQPSA